MDLSFLRNTSILTLSNVLSPIASMLLVLVIGRLRGPAELGLYSVAMAVFMVAESVSALGLPVIATREVARKPETAGPQFLAGCLVSVAVVIPILSIGVPLLLMWGGPTPLVAATCVLVFAVVPSIVTGFGTAIFLGLEQVSDFVLIDLVEKCCRAALGSLLIYAGFGVLALACLILTLRIAAAAVYVLKLRGRGMRIPHAVDWRLCAELFRHIPVTGTIPLLNALYARIDIFMLGWLGSIEAVGLYGAALRLVDVTRTFPGAFGRALYPRLARLAAGPIDPLMTAVRTASRHLLLAVGMMVLLLVGLADLIIPMLLGVKFTAAALVLLIVAWAVLPYALSCVFSNALFATDHQAADMRVNLICIVCAPILHYVLIPPYGVVGAALATCLCAGLYGALQYRFVHALIAPARLGGMLARLALALAVAAVARYWLSGLDPRAATSISLAVFLALCFMTGLLTRRDRTEARALLEAVQARRQARQVA